MLNFHFCQKYIDSVPREVDKAVRKRISNLLTRESLRGVSGVFSYNGVYVLQTNTPLPMRTIVQEDKVTIKDETVSVFFVQDIVAKDDIEAYVDVRKGRWSSYYPLLESDKRDFIESLKINYGIYEKEPLPDHLVSWLSDYRIQVDYDIYESKEWIAFAAGNGNGMRQEDITAFRGLLCDIIDELEEGVMQLKEIENTRLESKESRSGLGIVYSRIEIHDKNIYLLHGGAHIKRQSDLWEKVKEEALKTVTSYQNIDEIGRVAERAYPKWVLKNKNDELWKNIQRISESGNLALLTEQTDFLNKFKFPAYIDGQAGSGKSTMLYYLFANAYYYKCLGEIKGDIVFLTENSTLLESTKRTIRDILRNNPAYELSDDYIVNLDDCFSTLKNFLHAQLDENDKNIFPIEDYLDFPKFKEKYESNPHIPKHVKDRFTPEFAWFAITTYIKGHDLEHNINSANYDDMPREGKQLISKEDLQQIETGILPFYEKLTDEGNYWDKVKIIRHIKEKIGTHKRYEVIFCDEAQDFGRIELQFIVNLSEYVQYNLSLLQLINQGVPVVFAGDPFQTVNPTGFRKAEVKDLFYKELNADLNKNQYKPTYNYRSSQAIVNLSNAIQFLRKQKFDIQGTPQKTKRPQAMADEYLDKFISFETLSTQTEHYIEELKYKTIIVPVDSDNKEKYISNNLFLNQFIQHHSIEEYKGSKNDDLVRTSVEAKGVDYPQVVVHGFGKYCSQEFGHYDNIENNYDARFFFNKLYVAVTRAQEELIIIDSEETLAHFWRPMLNDYANSEWQMESGVDREFIINSICQIKDGNANIIKQGTRDAEIEVAKKEKEQALYQNDTDLMRMAASRFIKLGNNKEYYLCKAEEAKMHGNFEQAVDYYRKKEVGIEGVELASNTYWEAERLIEYAELIGTPKNSEQELRIIISNLMTSDRLTPDEARKLEKNSGLLEIMIRKSDWGVKILEKLAEFAKTVTEKEQQSFLIDLFKAINTASNRNLNYEIGQLQYKRGNFSEAIITWADFDEIEENELYVKARIEVAKQEEKYAIAIDWLGKLLDSSQVKEKIEAEIITLYETFSETIDRSNHPLAHLFVSGAYLVQKPFATNLLNVVRIAEQGLSNKRKTLTDYYVSLLQSGRLSETSFGFVLERWAKNKALDGIDLQTINGDYQRLIAKNTLEYPFTPEEIVNIPLEPSSLERDLPEHIHTITIQNFRKFRDVTIENLGNFNLVVGDNNIGKTSLLEAFLFTPDKKEYLKRLAFAYVERKNVYPDKKEANNLLKMFYSLDKEFLKDIKNQEENHFNLQFIFREGRLTWKYFVSDNEFDDIDSSFQHLRFEEDDYNILKELSIEDALQQPFIPYGKGFGLDLAIIYSNEIAPNINIEDQFLKNLALFIPNVRRVRDDVLKGDIFILLEGAEKETPLHQFGEGANKLFRILLLLTLHKGKRVMIDEIDAGIHYSRFKDFWKIILKVAQQNNTQVIATTHNEECIEYFSEALKELGEAYEEVARVVQCKMVAEKLKIRSYDFKNFSFALDKGIELRGGDDL
jgi:hypothetical protein